MIHDIREWLKGKKTYLLMAGGMITATTAWITGTIELPALVEAVVALAMGGAVRAGIVNR